MKPAAHPAYQPSLSGNRSQSEATVSCLSTAVSNYDMDIDDRRVHKVIAQRSRTKERCEVSLRGNVPNR